MKELKNKVFYTLFLIFTVSILSFIVVFNVQHYVEQKKSISNSLDIATNTKTINRKPLNMQTDETIKFMDSTIYTILIDDDDTIKEIINHSNNELTINDITVLAKNILGKTNIQSKHIGCLYFDDYSYIYIKGNVLIILDNSRVKASLLTSLEISLLIFIILEVLVLFISKMITKRITQPVKNSFDKQKQFIADASHELKTPLSVIIASSEALEDNPTEKKWLVNIKSEAERMNLLITDLLELAASDNQECLKMALGNLSKTVELASLTFEGKAFETGIKMKYQIEPNIQIKMNDNSIKQLVEILLDNAIKHSYPKETVTLILKDKNDGIELLVQNIGDSIPKEEEQKIFERFYRIDKSRNRKENRYGLGLAIAKNIVENHNGKITTSSDDGITTFKVLLKH